MCKKIFLLMLFGCLTFKAHSSVEQICQNNAESSEFIKIREIIKRELISFANKKVVAEKADQTLSNLLSAKSAILINWMNKRKLNTNNEEEVVREWRLYYAQNFILSKYPHNDKLVNKEIEILISFVNSNFATMSFKEKIEKLFHKSMKFSEIAISNLGLNKKSEVKILERIKAIKLYWMKDFTQSKFKKMPLEFLDWGIAYDPVLNEINMGLNSLAYPNDEIY